MCVYRACIVPSLACACIARVSYLHSHVNVSRVYRTFIRYHYLTFLGYSELPFLHRCECFVYPIALVLLAFVVSLPFNFNATVWVARYYFGS